MDLLWIEWNLCWFTWWVLHLHDHSLLYGLGVILVLDRPDSPIYHSRWFLGIHQKQRFRHIQHILHCFIHNHAWHCFTPKKQLPIGRLHFLKTRRRRTYRIISCSMHRLLDHLLSYFRASFIFRER